MNEYSQSNENAATSSETDANANVTMKNVATLRVKCIRLLIGYSEAKNERQAE
jgi:hypothetical protein